MNDKTRIAILYELAEGPRNVSSIVEAVRLPQGTVSRHLKVLREGGMVLATRDANRVVYQLLDPRVLEALDLLREILAQSYQRQTEVAQRIRSARSRSSGRGRPR